MKRIRHSPAARADVDEIWSYIALDNADAARRMVERITGAVARLAEFPMSAPARPEFGDRIRCLAVGSYLVLYRVERDHVLIVRVVHAARDIEALRDQAGRPG